MYNPKFLTDLMTNLNMNWDYENIVTQSVTNHAWFRSASMYLNGNVHINIVTDIDEFTGNSLLKSFISNAVSFDNTYIQIVVDNYLAPYEVHELKNFVYEVERGDGSNIWIVKSNKRIKGRYCIITGQKSNDSLLFSEKTCGTFTNQATPGFVSYKDQLLSGITGEDFKYMFAHGDKLK